MATEWVTWALQGLIGFLLLVVWQKLEQNAKSILDLTAVVNDFKLDIAKNYIRESRYTPEWEEVRRRLHVVEGWQVGTEMWIKMHRDRHLNKDGESLT